MINLKNDNPVLVVAIMNDLKEVVKLLIENKVDITNDLVIHTAINFNRIEIHDYIMEKKVEMVNWENRRTLLKAWVSNTPISKLN